MEIMFVTAYVIFFLSLISFCSPQATLVHYFLSLELMFLAVNLLFVLAGALWGGDITGQVFALYVLVLAGAESALGLALLVLWYRLRNGIEIYMLSDLRY